MKPVVIQTASVLLAIVLCFAGFQFIIGRSIDQQRTEFVPPFADVLAEQLYEMTDGLPDDELSDAVAHYGELLHADAELVPLAGTAFPEYIGPRLEAGQAGWQGDRDGVTIYLPLRDGRHAVVLGPVQGIFSPDPADVAKAVLLMLLVAVAAATIPMIPMARRLRRLDRATQALGEGSLDARVPVRKGGPVGDLEHRFNQMADRVEELLAGQQQLVQAVAHEIRTPIARVQFQLEMMELAQDDAERQRRATELRDELDELDEMVGELLVFSRYDRGTTGLSMEAIDIADAVEQQVRRAAERYPEIDVSLDGIDDGTTVVAHHRSFHRVLQNLVANALRYAEHRVVIRVQAKPDGALELQVEDDGPGIPEPDRERIFEPFARVDDSRNRGTGGVGLGLAIVHRILEAHGGDVFVEAGEGGGARFVTRWPGRAS
jgi:two-component system, OmpR family, sensor histidine kinase RstB